MSRIQQHMYDLAIAQITGFEHALYALNDAGSLAMSMGLTEEEWEKIKLSESWIHENTIAEIDNHFSEERKSE